MFKNLITVCLALLLVLSLGFSACAETERGDLDSRFDSVPHVEYGGASYSLRSRLTTVLAMAVSTDDQGISRAGYARVLVVDDNQKIFSKIGIAENALAVVPADEEGGSWNMRYADVYALNADREAACQMMVDVTNDLLGQELVEHYIAFELEGATVLNGGVPVEGGPGEQLRVLKNALETMSTEELNDAYGKLGDYIETDMKSGALMQIADKSDRYEILPTVMLPGTEADAGENGTVLMPDADGILQLVVDLFFEESIW